MAHAEICLICKGNGKKEAKNTENDIVKTYTQPCHGCFGRGWVEIADALAPLPQYQYYGWSGTMP